MADKISPAATLADANVSSDILDRLAKVREKLDAAQKAIALGRVAPAETKARLALFKDREIHKRARVGRPEDSFATAADLDTVERIIGSNDILMIDFFRRGMIAARSVGCILTMGERCATGFLVAPRILITNQHVLSTKDAARASWVTFELSDAVGVASGDRDVAFDPDRFWFTDERLDVTLVGLDDTQDTTDLGWHPMIAQQGKIRIGDPINIIQHPGGRPKSVVVHNSNLLHLENDTELMPYAWYNSDTEPGSSGSPVFNRYWEVIGLHRRSVPRTNSKGELLDIHDQPISQEDFKRNPNLAVWIANEGSRTSQIVATLENAEFENAHHTIVRDDLLALWEGSRHHNRGQGIDAQSTTANPALADGSTESVEAQEGSVVRSGGVTIQIIINTGGR